MFDNLKQSEKMMLAAVACLLPVGLFFMFFVSYSNEHKNRATRIAGLENKIVDEESKMLNAMNAGLRRQYYYRAKSLPADNGLARSNYRDWLFERVDQSGLKNSKIGAPESSTIKYSEGGVSTVANKYRYSITTAGSLDEIVKFCYGFYEVDLLHKISSLSITPKRKNDVLTGEHGVTMKVEVLALVDAAENREFLAAIIKPEKEIKSYEDKILSRNIFGPANSPPSLSVSRKSYETGEDISFTLSGRDPDDKDKLSYELVDAGGIEGIEIIQKGDTRATFKCPPLEVGEYKVKIAVRDSGFPSKSAEDEFKLVIKEPKIVKTKEKEVEPPKPVFVNATKTKIKRINLRKEHKDAPGVYSVKLDVMTKGEKFELTEGESFELDDKTWLVKKIDTHTLTLEVDGKQLEFRKGDLLSEPRNEIELEAVEPAEVSTVTD